MAPAFLWGPLLKTSPDSEQEEQDSELVLLGVDASPESSLVMVRSAHRWNVRDAGKVLEWW